MARGSLVAAPLCRRRSHLYRRRCRGLGLTLGRLGMIEGQDGKVAMRCISRQRITRVTATCAHRIPVAKAGANWNSEFAIAWASANRGAATAPTARAHGRLFLLMAILSFLEFAPLPGMAREARSARAPTQRNRACQPNMMSTRPTSLQPGCRPPHSRRPQGFISELTHEP